MEVTIVAEIIARNGREDDLRAALKGLVKPTLALPGCRRYDLHEDRARPGHFLFYETWRSRAAWRRREKDSPDLAEFQRKAPDLVQLVALYEMERLADE